MVDVMGQIASVERGIDTREVDGVLSYVQTLSQTYPTSLEDLWDAVTSAERIPRWFLPINGDLTLGGHYQFEGNAGGEITACEPPAGGSAGYSVTWGMGGEPATVQVRLTSLGASSTRFELINIAAADSLPEGVWDQFGPSATGMGWDSGLLGLALYLGGGDAGVNPETAAAWLASDEGKSFLKQSSQAWAAQHERAGASPEVAAAAAETTYRMYIGEAAPPMG